MIITSRFRAMGTDVELLVDAENDPGVHAALLECRGVIEDIESKLSRFRPDSELSRLNRDGYAPAPSRELFDALELGMEARTTTGGRFDPSVGSAVLAAGYDRSFERLPAVVQGRPACPTAQGTPVFLDPLTGAIHLMPGVRVDLGGIAKGMTAEIVAEMLSGIGPCLVGIGGDIAVRGVPRRGDWPVAITTADQQWVVGLTDGGLATSGRDRRTWTTASGEVAHHVIDPRTGAPARTDILRISVFAATAVDAETTATALMIAGADEALREAQVVGCEAIVVTDQGRTLTTPGLA